MDIFFLGMNDIGWEIYEWLCDRQSTTVLGIATTEKQLELVAQLRPDVVVASGFTHVVPTDVLAVPDEGCINLHPGYLPQTRGYNPNVWSIVENRPAGATLHYMDDGIDKGDVIAKTEVPRYFTDDGKSLYQRIEQAAVELFKQTWPEIENGQADARSQDETKANSHVKQDFVDLCEIGPEETYRAKDLVDRLRALTFPPYDNAYMEIDGETYYIEVEVSNGLSGEAERVPDGY